MIKKLKVNGNIINLIYKYKLDQGVCNKPVQTLSLLSKYYNEINLMTLKVKSEDNIYN